MTMKIESTAAKIGRSMKKRENMMCLRSSGPMSGINKGAVPPCSFG